MKIVAGSEQYLNVRNNWLLTQNWPECGIDAVQDNFIKLISDYEGVFALVDTVDGNSMYTCDCVGLIPDIDEIRFSNDKKYVEFILRWA